MNRLAVSIVICVLAAPALARDQYVQPYVRKDGTFVEGHMRSTPNAQRMDNLGSQNNLYGGQNPYTGQRGTQRDELSSPPAFNLPRKTCTRDAFGNVSCL